MHQAGNRLAVQANQAGRVQAQRLLQMTVQQQSGELAEQWIVADQQAISGEFLQMIGGLAWRVFRGGPVHRGQGQPDAKRFAYQLGCLLGTQVRTGENVRQWLAAQVLGASAYLLAPAFGERTLGVAARPRFSLTVAQQP